MCEQKKCYIGVIAEEEIRFTDTGEIYLHNVESFTDWNYYKDWKDAWLDMQNRADIYNDRQRKRVDTEKFRFGYYRRRVLEVYRVVEPVVR